MDIRLTGTSNWDLNDVEGEGIIAIKQCGSANCKAAGLMLWDAAMDA
jgi:hypothetical protein